MKFQWKQNGLALISALIWGTAFVAQDLCSGKIGPFFFNAARSAIAVAVLGAFLLIRTGVKKKRGTYQKGNRKQFWLGSLICGFLLSVAANLQQFGIADSGTGKASFLTALYVVLVPIIGRFFGKKNGINVWLGVIAAAAGMYFLCIKGDFTVATGDLFLIACAVAFALQVIAVDHFIEKVDGIALSWGQFFFTMIFSGIFTLIFDKTPAPQELVSCLIPILYVGLFSSCIAYTLQNIAQKDANPTVVSLIFSLESVFGAVAGALILREVLEVREYLGCVLMLGGVVLAQIPFPKKARKN